MDGLPIDSALPALREALAHHTCVILQAPPGSGKTTRVPLALLDERWLAGRRIVMLEPRRLAARAAAAYMARGLGEPVGATVGHRVRRDTRVGPRTRLEVVTEGVLTRLIQADASLEGVGLLVFDEFHERSQHADLGLALALETQTVVRPDLRLLVMSATLDEAQLSRLLGAAPTVTASARSFPVETRYRSPREGVRLEDSVARAVLGALTEEPGDLLVFLPGAPEIRRVGSKLSAAGLDPTVAVVPLYGDLAAEAQDAAIRPSAPGRRKVVLATSIAQTSLTIEGIRVVIDAGLSRVPRFSPRTGMTRLATVRVSLASADQRRGRAGRLASGVCYRLWAERLDQTLRPHDTPEILDADLASLALELAAAGIADAGALRWIDPPPPAALAQARDLLGALGAVDHDGRITAHGRRMAALGIHPRLGHLLIKGAELGFAHTASELAALLADRDPLRGTGADVDLRTRLEALRRGDSRIPKPVLRRLRAEAKLLREVVGASGRPDRGDVSAAGLLLSLAYPDRIGLRRPGPGQRFLLRSGQGAQVVEPQSIGAADSIVAAELDGDARESRIFLAAPITREEILEQHGDQLVTEDVVAWDGATDAVLARRQQRLGALVLREAPLRDPDPAEVRKALLGWIARSGLGVLPWTDAASGLRARLRFLRTLDDRWPDVSDSALTNLLESWLGPALAGLRRRSELKQLDLESALLSLLDWQQRRDLDQLAPSHIEVPSGSRLRIDYTDPSAPALPVRLQEVFGWHETPRIGGERVPLTLHLLSPAGRPVQVTRDLAGFWQGTYFDVRKDLKGRYPKHYWPEDPLSAVPTRRLRPSS